MNRLRFERLERGWSQHKVGVIARVNQSTLAQIELGNLKPSPAVLARLASVFRVPPSALLEPVAIADTEDASA